MSLSDWPGYRACLLTKKCIRCGAEMSPVPQHVDFHQMCDECVAAGISASSKKQTQVTSRFVLKWKQEKP